MADETPTVDEATHLAGCWDCRAELAAYRRLARMSAMAPTPLEPLSAWSALAPQLRAEGIIAGASGTEGGGSGSHVRRINVRRPFGQVWMLRAAAGFALVLGGVAAGRATAGIGAGPDTSTAVPVASLPAFQSSDEAIRVLTSAQQQYQQAAAFLAAQDTSSRFIGMNQDAYQTRLAALDEIAAAARTALYRTPQDPMLNQYYLTTLGAREATLRQIGATLPASRRLERY
jgi:hypothetical protein